MSSDQHSELTFASQTVSAKFIDPGGQLVERPVEIRTNPLTGRTCRIAFSRIKEKVFTRSGVFCPGQPLCSNLKSRTGRI